MISKLRRIRVGGCPVDICSMEGAVEELCRRIDARVRTHVVFINAAKVVQYHENPALRSAVERADVLLADGMPIVWFSLGKRTPLPGRVAGVDLMDHMVAAAAERGYRVFFLGSKLEIVSRTVETFLRKYPALRVAGFRDGYFKMSDEEQVNAQINESKADLLFVGMSTPQKELWADRNLEKLGISVCQGVGGAFDIVAGITQRAPRWMQRAGLEWSYRLLQEPGRMWKRYLFTNLSFLALALRDLYHREEVVVGSSVQSPLD
jgi:N-acetylglucosaminyldiphosphoundecaprenol N-acetyl-beta-D-mannosaminyltransferase